MYLICTVTDKNKIEVRQRCTKEEALSLEKNLKLAVFYEENLNKANKEWRRRANVQLAQTPRPSNKVIIEDEEYGTAYGEYIKQNCKLKETFPYLNITYILDEYRDAFIIEAKSLLNG